MPTLKWKLKDTRFCQDCPFGVMRECDDGGGHIDIWMVSCYLDYDCSEYDRPQTCIDELGK